MKPEHQQTINDIKSLLRRVLSSWQGLAAGGVAIALYLMLPVLLRIYDPTAGLFDAGYLQWVGLATVLSCWAVFVGWVTWQVGFRSIDQAADQNLSKWFEALSDREKWYATQATYALMLALFIIALKLIPV
jgi:hypothetical protein